MKIIAISDTHGLHRNLKIPSGDLLIHAGDVTEFGQDDELEDFLDWFVLQPCKYKVFVAGNHDLCLEKPNNRKFKVFEKYVAKNVFYLQNSSIKIEHLSLWGSPVSPYFFGMAFNKNRGDEIKKVWQKIPSSTDILITHTPPFGILDNQLGCEQLLAKVMKVKPKLHIFGHIHQSYGRYSENDKLFVNASFSNQLDCFIEKNLKVVHVPHIIHL